MRIFNRLPWAVGEAGRGLRTAREASEVNKLRHRLSNSSYSRNAGNTNAHGGIHVPEGWFGTFFAR